MILFEENSCYFSLESPEGDYQIRNPDEALYRHTVHTLTVAGRLCLLLTCVSYTQMYKGFDCKWPNCITRVRILGRPVLYTRSRTLQ